MAFDRLNTLACGFTSQVGEICALQVVDGEGLCIVLSDT
jgi:hypothetical protein